MSKLPLSRFKVIDLTRARAGPTAVRQLADWGADVLKIETPDNDATEVGSRASPDFQNLHRNKRSLTLNLKHPEAVEILKRLVESADVLVENYRPDVKRRLGIDYDRLRAINPRLVYASISGFGQEGPYADRPGLDQIAQGMGGLMSITGFAGQGPVRVGIAIADLTAGVFCAMGILLALLEREESGEGQWVQTSLLAAQVAMLDFQAARWLLAGEVPEQAGNNHPTAIPTGVFATTDGHINIAGSGPELFARLCKALGAEQLAADPAYSSGKARLRNRDQLNAAIEAITRTRAVGGMDRDSQPRRRPLRPDLSHRPGFRRPASAAHRHRARDRKPRAWTPGTGRAGGGSEPHAVGVARADTREGRAYRCRAECARLRRGGDLRAARARRDLSATVI